MSATEALPFHDLKLLPGTKLDVRSEQYALLKGPSVFIGYQPHKGIIISTPLQAGRPVSCKAGNPLVVRFFVNHLNCACAFRTEVTHVALMPYPYLHLAIPESVQVGAVRSSARANVALPASVTSVLFDQPHPVMIQNLSAEGASVHSQAFLGDSGNRVLLRTHLTVLGVEHALCLEGVIRSHVLQQEKSVYGLQLEALDHQTQLVIYAYVMTEMNQH